MHWDWCTPEVMVMERMSGIPIARVDALREAGIDLKKLSRAGVEMFFTQVFRDGFFHADMHPGNIFVAVDPPHFGKYIALDFGIIGTLSEKDQNYLAQNFLAFFRRDYRRVATAHIESGWVPPDTRVDELETEIRVVCEPIFDRPLAEISLGKVLLQLFRASRRFNVEVQPQLVLLQKTLLNVEGLGRQLDPELDLWVTAKPFLERWMENQIGVTALQRRFMAEAPYLAAALPELPRLVHQRLLAQPAVSELQGLAAAQRALNRWLGVIAVLLAGCIRRPAATRTVASAATQRLLDPIDDRLLDHRRLLAGADAGQRCAPQERIRLAEQQPHEILERAFVELLGLEVQVHGLEAVDVGQVNADLVAAVVGIEAHRCGHGRRHRERSRGDDLALVLMRLVLEHHAAGAEATLDRSDGGRRNGHLERLRADQPIERLHIVEELQSAHVPAPVRNEALLDLQLRQREQRLDAELVRDDRLDDRQMCERFVEPAVRTPQTLVDVDEDLLGRPARRLGGTNGVRLLAQPIEQRGVLAFGVRHGMTLSRGLRARHSYVRRIAQVRARWMYAPPNRVPRSVTSCAQRRGGDRLGRGNRHYNSPGPSNGRRLEVRHACPRLRKRCASSSDDVTQSTIEARSVPSSAGPRQSVTAPRIATSGRP